MQFYQSLSVRTLTSGSTERWFPKIYYVVICLRKHAQ